MEEMKKIPYGKCNFEDIMLQNMYYVDKTKYIVEVEKSSDFFFFIRPRRFGKSLFLSMLENYYDINKKSRFEDLFGNLWIGQHPTQERNTYAVLKFDFSKVISNTAECEKSFNTLCYVTLDKFCDYYKLMLPSDAKSFLSPEKNATENLSWIMSKCDSAGLQVYVLIDEYDNFTNTMLSDTTSMKKYEGITHQDGFYRTFFASLKSATSSCLKKILLTGVSPVTLDDLTSGFNIGFNYTSYARFNEMLGFSETDVRKLLDYYRQFFPFKHTTDELFNIIKPWYDNYCFSANSLPKERVFNSDMTLYFISTYIESECNIPADMLDANIRIDYNKLLMLIRTDKGLEGQASVIQEIVNKGKIYGILNENFPARDVENRDNLVSLLYYFGMLTISGQRLRQYEFSIPNQAVREQMIDYLMKSYNAADLSLRDINCEDYQIDMALNGNWRPYFEKIAETLRNYSAHRDKQKGESYVHGFTFASVLRNNYYLPISENDTAEGYSDVYLQPRLGTYPDLMHSYIIEFKYVKGSATDSEVETKQKEATEQINRYAQTPQVQDTLGHTTLHKIVQVYRGFEVAVLEEVE